MYTDPLVISEDGIYIFSWYAVDSEGYNSTPDSISFKVDLTLPEINLKKERLAINKVKVIANVYDETSGIDRVRFQGWFGRIFIDYDFPFEWTWAGFFNAWIKVTVYDKAGNSNSSSISTWRSHSYRKQSSNPLFLGLFD